MGPPPLASKWAEMAYQFRGFFTKSKAAAELATHDWPFCIVQHVTEEMDGYVVRCPSEYDIHPSVPHEEYEAMLEQIFSLEESLPIFSKKFPLETFVYVHAECFGGTCLYEGHHIANGEITRSFERNDSTPNSLEDLLAPMSVSLGPNNHFSPFTREYLPLPTTKVNK